MRSRTSARPRGSRRGSVIVPGVRRFARWLRWSRWTTLAISVVLYALAFPPLVLLYEGKGHQLALALGAGAVGFVLGTALLATTGQARRRAALYGLGIGIVLAELAWAIGYWSVGGLVGGALLWLAFYVLAGISHAHMEEALERRVAVEYAVVATLGLAIVLVAMPWRP